jgi:hypothetical protein
MPTYALGRPLPSPPPCAHGGGGVQKAQEKLTGRSPCFCGAVGGATELTFLKNSTLYALTKLTFRKIQ